MSQWIRKFWYLVAPGILAGFGALWGIFRRKPSPAINIVTDEQRRARHEEIRKRHDEKMEEINERLENERRDAHDLFDDLD
jgi:hypothetical protein